MRGSKIMMSRGGICVGAVLWGILTISTWAQAADPQPQKPWNVGGTMGFLANTPEDTAFALNFNADANLNRQIAV